jgi:hypothetical protein
LTWFAQPLVSVGTNNQRGSVTAELVLTLPVVMLVIAIAIAAMSVQLTKLQLIESALQVARAVSRGESSELVDRLVSDSGENVSFEILEKDDRVCITLSAEVLIPGLDVAALELNETQCVRALGQ